MTGVYVGNDGEVFLLFFPSLPVPSLSLPLLSPLRSRAALKQLGGLGALKAPIAGSGAEPRPKTNLVDSRAVRKPLVAIIFSILKCIFHSRSIKI